MCFLPYLAFAFAATDDHPAARFAAVAGFGALGALTPRRDRVAATGGFTFTTTVRVVDRVHDDTTHDRAFAQPAAAAGFADLGVHVVGVGDGTDGGHAGFVHQADFATGQTHLDVGTVLTGDLHGRAGGAGHLAAATGLELYVVDHGADRNVFERQRVAGLDLGLRTGHHHVTRFDLLRSEDIG